MTPSLGRASLALFFSGLCVLILRSQAERLSLFWSGLLALTAGGFGIYGIAELANWFITVANLRWLELRQASAITAAGEALRLIAQMTPAAQAEIALHLGRIGIEFDGLVTSVGPIYRVQIGGHSITQEFIREFLDASDDQFLYPVRSYPEGTHERRWSVALTEHLVRYGYAEPAAGNQPARWKVHRTAAGRLNGAARARRMFLGVDEARDGLEQ